MTSPTSGWLGPAKWICAVSSFLLAANTVATVLLSDLRLSAAMTTCTAAVLFIRRIANPYGSRLCSKLMRWLSSAPISSGVLTVCATGSCATWWQRCGAEVGMQKLSLEWNKFRSAGPGRLKLEGHL